MNDDQLKLYSKRLQHYVDEMEKQIEGFEYNLGIKTKWAALKGYLAKEYYKD